MTKYFILSIFAILSLANDAFAQSKVLGRPETMVRPKDYYSNFRTNETVDKSLLNNTKEKTKSPWMGFSDRDNNALYESYDENSKKIGSLKFKQYFFIIEERSDWIRVANAPGLEGLKSKRIEPLGWVKKSNVLLWTQSLVDPNSEIDRKAFLLNKAEDWENVIEEKINAEDHLVHYTSDPEGKNDIGHVVKYNIFYVLKKENGMALLSREARINKLNVETKLLGWFPSRKILEWNTRMCLEANFNPEAVAERKANKTYLVSFGDRTGACAYQAGIEGSYVQDHDPANDQEHEVSKSDPNRHRGTVLRLPLFNVELPDDDYGKQCYRSGAIGSIKLFNDQRGSFDPRFDEEIMEQSWSYSNELVKMTEKKINNVNIFFIIEGTRYTASYKEDVLKAINNIPLNQELDRVTNVKYGALIYKDEAEGSNVHEIERLTPSLEKVSNFIQNVDFNDLADQDEFSAMYSGIYEGIKKAGFNKEELNIVILLGANGDFSMDDDREAYAMSHNSEYLIEGSTLHRSISSLDIHFHALQLENNDMWEKETYNKLTKKLIRESAYIGYNKLQQIDFSTVLEYNEELEFGAPKWVYEDDLLGEAIQGSNPGLFIYPDQGKRLTNVEISDNLDKIISRSVSYERGMYESMHDMLVNADQMDLKKYEMENNISIPNWTSGYLKYWSQLFESSKLDADLVNKTTEMNISVFDIVYVPIKIDGAQYPLTQYVLFLPEEDLDNYRNIVRTATKNLTEGAPDQRRMSLYSLYVSLVGKFAGRQYDADDITTEQLANIIQGLGVEGGISIESEFNVKIEDVMDEDVVSNEQVDALLARFAKIEDRLINILSNSDYEFKFEGDEGNEYYWLRVEDMF